MMVSVPVNSMLSFQHHKSAHGTLVEKCVRTASRMPERSTVLKAFGMSSGAIDVLCARWPRIHVKCRTPTCGGSSTLLTESLTIKRDCPRQTAQSVSDRDGAKGAARLPEGTMAAPKTKGRTAAGTSPWGTQRKSLLRI